MRLYILLCLLFTFINKTSGNDWKLVINEKGVQVYTRPVTNASFDEFKAVTIVNAKIEVIGELLRDISNYPSWVKDCKEAKVLTRKDASNLTIYFVQDAPWPVSPRDVIMDVITTMDLKVKTITIAMSSVNSALVKKNPDYVRMPTLKGAYILEYIDRNQTRVTYISKADPGGSLPTSLANYSSRTLPYETLLNMKKMVQQPKYIKLGEKSTDKTLIEEAIQKGILK